MGAKRCWTSSWATAATASGRGLAADVLVVDDDDMPLFAVVFDSLPFSSSFDDDVASDVSVVVLATTFSSRAARSLWYAGSASSKPLHSLPVSLTNFATSSWIATPKLLPSSTFGTWSVMKRSTFRRSKTQAAASPRAYVWSSQSSALT